jgi:hypothetical protein
MIGRMDGDMAWIRVMRMAESLRQGGGEGKGRISC